LKFPEKDTVNEAVFARELRAISAEKKRQCPGEQELAQNPQVVNGTLYNSRYFQPALLAHKSRRGPLAHKRAAKLRRSSPNPKKQKRKQVTKPQRRRGRR
jgi:hypothetical protein